MTSFAEKIKMLLSNSDFDPELVKTDLTSLRSSRMRAINSSKAKDYSVLAFDYMLNRYALSRAHSFEERTAYSSKCRLHLSDGSTLILPAYSRVFTIEGPVPVKDLEIGTQLIGGTYEIRPEGLILSTWDQKHYTALLRMRRRLQLLPDYISPEYATKIEILQEIAKAYQTLLHTKQPINWDTFCLVYAQGIMAMPNIREYIEYHYCAVFESFVHNILCPMYGQFVTGIETVKADRSDSTHTFKVDKYNSVCVKTKDVQTDFGYGVGFIVLSTF